jgi:hypothetical protein
VVDRVRVRLLEQRCCHSLWSPRLPRMPAHAWLRDVIGRVTSDLRG